MYMTVKGRKCRCCLTRENKTPYFFYENFEKLLKKFTTSCLLTNQNAHE